jgi:predicted DNA-binding transcriptional regulator AlpA
VTTEYPVILRTKDIALMLSVSKPTACKLLHTGKIPKINLTQKAIGAYRVDVEAYIAQNRYA